MPFENEALLKVYVSKIDVSKKGVEILFKKTIEILQPDKVEPVNSTLKNVDVTIRDRLSIANRNDLFAVLMRVNETTLRSYFLKLEEVFKQKSINNDIVIQFLLEILHTGTNQQLEAMGRLSEALFVLTKKILKQLPASPSSLQVLNREASLGMMRLAKCVYAIDASCYEKYSKQLVAAAHNSEISYFQLFQFMEHLLDEEFQTKMKQNIYLRSNNVITNMLVTLIPPEDRAGFILLIATPLLSFVNSISLIQLRRAANNHPKFNIDAEKAKFIKIKSRSKEKTPLSDSDNELSELIETNAKNIQDIIIGLYNAETKLIPPFIKIVCQMIHNNLSKNFSRLEDNKEKIALQVSSFIINKICASIGFGWLKNTCSKDNTYLKSFNFLILKPLQTLITNIQSKGSLIDNQKPEQLPESMAQTITRENHLRLLTFANRIIEELPPTIQVLCLTVKDCNAFMNSLPVQEIPPGPPPINMPHTNQSTNTDDDIEYFSSSDESDESDEENNKQDQIAQPTKAVRMANMNEFLQAAKPSAKMPVVLTTLIRPSPQNELAVSPILQFDKALDEIEIELRLLIIFEECLAIANKLNIAIDLPSQSTLLPKIVHQKFFAPTPLLLPTRKNMSDDLFYISQKLAQNDSEDKKRLIILYKELDAAVCSFDGYKTFNVSITKAGLNTPMLDNRPSQAQGFVNIPLSK